MTLAYGNEYVALLLDHTRLIKFAANGPLVPAVFGPDIPASGSFKLSSSTFPDRFGLIPFDLTG